MNRKGLEVLYQVTKVINSILDYPCLLEKVMDLAIETVGAERGAIVLFDDDNNLELVVARHISKENLNLAELSSSVVWRVIKEKKPLLLHDVQDEQEFQQAKSVLSHNIQSVLCVPLALRDKLSGVIYVDSRSSKGVFTRENLEFLVAFSEQAAIALENARLHKLVLDENLHLKQELMQGYEFTNIIGTSPKMLVVFELMKKVLATSMPVLIYGETGTGKELVARALHYNGTRRDARFIPIYCGSLPEALLESELFGYKKGAFTGATQDKKGLFEEANHGTLLLDEVADINLNIQAKLLRAIQEKEFFRVGDTTPRKVDVRIISATNKDLETEIREKRFREDLYYRLNVILIKLPALRERPGDVPLLTRHFLKKYTKETGKEIKGFSTSALRALERHSWPGNVRELENLIARGVALADGKLITPDVLGFDRNESSNAADKPLKETLKRLENQYIRKVLAECKGNRKLAAQRLGISLRSLQYKIQDLPDAEKI
jgi:Nif-specific regulatory protein